ncbi:hypothetical protein DV735_g3408, partial [Chaetothyriales sp. CBS 134920]
MAIFRKFKAVRSPAQPGCWTPQSVTKLGARDEIDFTSRVGKSRISSTKQSRRKMANSEKIADLIDEHRKKLRQDTDTKLREDEDVLNHNLDTLKAEFQSQIEVLRDAEGPILQSMADERLRVALEVPEFEGAADEEFEVVYLRNRVEAFEAYVQAKEQEIARLMAEWNDTQVEILCLAVEMVGRHRFKIVDEIPRSMDQTVKQANDKYKHAQEEHENELARIVSVELKVKQLTQETKKRAKAQQKELKTKQNKKLKDLTVYLRSLVETGGST